MTDDVIKVYVGCSPNGEDAESLAVLEYSARKVTTGPVEFHWMKLSRDPNNPWYSNPPEGWNTIKWATPFSGFRWGIPWACGYKGKALYMDSDMIVLQDLRELWNLDLGDKLVAAKKPDRLCVALWNCEKFGELVQKGILPDISQGRTSPDLHAFMQHFIVHSAPTLMYQFDRKWNNFDGEHDPIENIGILHYTDMSTQMHTQKYAIPRLAKDGRKHWFDGELRQHRRQDVVELFDRLLAEAEEAGYKVANYDPPPEQRYGDYRKQSQKGYRANNGFDVTQGQ